MSTKTLSVCLFSGGLDSATAAFLCRSRGDALYLLSVNYEQVMQRELIAARRVAREVGAFEHQTINLHGFKEISESARTNASLLTYNDDTSEVPSAYPPGRDLTFIGMATAWAETLVLRYPECYDEARIVIGTNRTDGLDYPDCQPHVYEQLTELLQASLKITKVMGKRIRVEAPLVRLSKTAVVRLGLELNVPFEHTWSCYEGGGAACGQCDACRIRYHAFVANGYNDPISYRCVPGPLVRHSRTVINTALAI